MDFESSGTDLEFSVRYDNFPPVFFSFFAILLLPFCCAALKIKMFISY